MSRASVQIEIPLPPEGCGPNTYRHWTKKSAAARTYREEAHLLARAAHSGPPFDEPVIVSCEWFMGKTAAQKLGADRRYRPLDTANAIASLKAAIDGIVDAGVLTGDSHKHLSWGRTILHRAAKEHGGRACVVLTFEADK